MKNKLIRIGVLSTWLVGAFCSVSAGKETNHIYLLAGGVNALGVVNEKPLNPERISNYQSFARMWNGNMTNEGKYLQENNRSWAAIAPQLHTKGKTDAGQPNILSLGPEYGFCSMMQRRKWHDGKGDTVRVIKGAVDAGGECWDKDEDVYNNYIRTIVDAMGNEGLKGNSVIHAFLWLNGENEAEDRIAKVARNFQDMLSRMDKDMRNGAPPLKADDPPPDPNAPKKVVPKWLKKGMPPLVVVGENAAPKEDGDFKDAKDAKGKTVVKLMHSFVQKKKKMGWVRTRDLTFISGQKVYDGESQLTIGARYAYVVAQLEKLPMPCARNDAPEAALNTPTAWWAGKMPQASEVALWDISAAKTPEGEKLSEDWRVGGILVEDPCTRTVIIRSKDEKAPKKLILGDKGISVKDGNITIKTPLEASADQTWDIKIGRTISVGSKDEPVALTGNACITLEAMNNSNLELHLTALPEVTWKLPLVKINTKITVDGKPADFKKAEGDSYTIAVKG